MLQVSDFKELFKEQCGVEVSLLVGGDFFFYPFGSAGGLRSPLKVE